MPTPNGVVYLCKNALVTQNYEHTIDFKNPEEQLGYWGSLIKYTVRDVTYVRKQRQYIVVPYTLDNLKDVNYLYYRATENSKFYFCFIDDKEYLNDGATTVYFHIDVLQTYQFDYKLKQSYVVQEHVDRWDADHNPIYSRTDEGLDYGKEYTVESAYKVDGDPDLRWYLAICTTHDVISGNTGSNTKIARSSNPYVFYLLPDHDDTHTFKFNSYLAGLGTTEATVADLEAFSEVMADSTMGAYVKQVVRLPYLPFKVNFKLDGVYSIIDFTARENRYCIFGAAELMAGKFFIKIDRMLEWHSFKRLLAEMGIYEGIESALPTAEQWAEIKANPYTTERDKRFESKLLTHPYRYNLLTDWRGNPVVIKNEYIGSDKIKLNYTQGLGINAPARYWIEGYKKDPEGRGSSLTQLLQDEESVINDAYYEYMLANKNQIQANQTNAIVNSVSNVAQSLVGGAIFGGGAGAVSGALTGAVNGAINYQNMIRSENAKQSDLKNLPDTIINSNDGTFNLMDDNRYVTFYRMKICCEFEELLADTFATSGYTVKRLKVPNTRSRVRYNYIKTIGANIVGSFDQNDLAIIKAIYDKGLTIWHYNPNHFNMFDYSLENIETNLI